MFDGSTSYNVLCYPGLLIQILFHGTHKHIFNLMHCTFLEGDKMSCHNDLEKIVMYNSNRCIV